MDWHIASASCMVETDETQLTIRQMQYTTSGNHVDSVTSKN